MLQDIPKCERSSRVAHGASFSVADRGSEQETLHTLGTLGTRGHTGSERVEFGTLFGSAAGSAAETHENPAPAAIDTGPSTPEEIASR